VIGLGGDDGDLISLVDLDPRPENGGRLYLQDFVGEIDETTFTNVMAFGLDELHELRTLEPEGCAAGSTSSPPASIGRRSRVLLVHLHDAIAQARLCRSRHLANRGTAAAAAGSDRPARVAAGAGDRRRRPRGRGRADRRRDRGPGSGDPSGGRGRGDHPAGAALEPLHREWLSAAERLAAFEGTTLVHPDRDAWKRALAQRRPTRAGGRPPQEDPQPTGPRRRPRAGGERPSGGGGRPSPRCSKKSRGWNSSRRRRRVSNPMRDWRPGGSASRSAWPGCRGSSQWIACSMRLAMPPRISSSPRASPLSFSALRAARPAACSRASRRVREVKRALARAKGQLADTRGVVASSDIGGMTIAAAIEEAARHACTGLRRRITLGEQVEELERFARPAWSGRWPIMSRANSCRSGWLVPSACSSWWAQACCSPVSCYQAKRDRVTRLRDRRLGPRRHGPGVGHHLFARPRLAATRLEAARQQYEMVQGQPQTKPAISWRRSTGKCPPTPATRSIGGWPPAQAELDRPARGWLAGEGSMQRARRQSHARPPGREAGHGRPQEGARPGCAQAARATRPAPHARPERSADDRKSPPARSSPSTTIAAACRKKPARSGKNSPPGRSGSIS